MTNEKDTTSSSGQVDLKTVFDTTRRDDRGHFAAQLRLHVASWAKNVDSSSGLTVTCIGEPRREIREFLDSLGAHAEIMPHRHPLYERSPIYNKHLAAPDPESSERIFLTDNDTIYLGDIEALRRVPTDQVALSLPDLQRISPELWADLISDLSLPVINLEWVPWKERGLAAAENRQPVGESLAYFNGGAILFPAGPDLWRTWEEETYRISAYLEQKGLHDRHDAGSDQLSLTAAVADYGKWRFLPPGYNIRPFRLWLSEPELDRVIQLHMVNSGRAVRALRGEEQGSLTALLKKYWQIYLRENVAPEHEDLARTLLRQTLDLVSEYELDRYL